VENYKHENCAFLSYYTASSGNSLPTFRDNVTDLSSGVIFFYF